MTERNCYQEPSIITPADEVDQDPWILLRRKFSTAAAIKGSTTFNSIGCKAIVELMDNIAEEVNYLRKRELEYPRKIAVARKENFWVGAVIGFNVGALIIWYLN